MTVRANEHGTFFGPGATWDAMHGVVDLQEAFTRLLDDATVAKAKAEYEAGRGSGDGEVARHRIGSGYVGVECDRALAYRYHKAEKEEIASTVSPGQLFRHAQSGHWTETAMAEWMRAAWFDLATTRPDGRQFGWHAARDPETGQARLAGEVDGIIRAVPPLLAQTVPVPAIWESKKATAKKWKKFAKERVRKADPKYFGQLQINMAYMEIEHTVFTMLNLDDMAIYVELVAFDAAEAQRLSDRAVQVLQSGGPEEFARVTGDPSDFRCRYCDYQGACWARADAAAPAKPNWLGA